MAEAQRGNTTLNYFVSFKIFNRREFEKTARGKPSSGLRVRSLSHLDGGERLYYLKFHVKSRKCWPWRLGEGKEQLHERREAVVQRFFHMTRTWWMGSWPKSLPRRKRTESSLKLFKAVLLPL